MAQGIDTSRTDDAYWTWVAQTWGQDTANKYRPRTTHQSEASHPYGYTGKNVPGAEQVRQKATGGDYLISNATKAGLPGPANAFNQDYGYDTHGYGSGKETYPSGALNLGAQGGQAGAAPSGFQTATGAAPNMFANQLGYTQTAHAMKKNAGGIMQQTANQSPYAPPSSGSASNTSGQHVPTQKKRFASTGTGGTGNPDPRDVWEEGTEGNYWNPRHPNEGWWKLQSGAKGVLKMVPAENKTGGAPPEYPVIQLPEKVTTTGSHEYKPQTQTEMMMQQTQQPGNYWK
ncbi:hypothetical protein B0J11DRAFT_574715 [Dendryphion nanum]|uniref:Uncharacterized protein n=1 Tax=Dendryphion nanum TaxID=256645 RepID=A0A9P9EIB4_9PLEO|nr:hypothetical protein B0J11DRAFT_574715 [Dendryphion nanum]